MMMMIIIIMNKFSIVLFPVKTSSTPLVTNVQQMSEECCLPLTHTHTHHNATHNTDLQSAEFILSIQITKTFLSTYTCHQVMMMMYACIYNAVTPCYCCMLATLSRVVVSFEACCQWTLLIVQITRHCPTILVYCTGVHLSFCR